MFKSFTPADHSERLLAIPPHHTISFNDAQALRQVLLRGLPPGTRIDIFGAAAGGPGADYDEKWIQDNTTNKDRPVVMRLLVSGLNIGQAQPADPLVNARMTAERYLHSPRQAAEELMVHSGATQAEIDQFHLQKESVQQAINALYQG